MPADSHPASDIVRALRSIIDLYGPSMLYEPDTLARYLRDECSGSELDIVTLLLALDADVPQALLAVHTVDESRALGTRLAARLVEERDMAQERAAWAVETWAHALDPMVHAPMPPVDQIVVPDGATYTAPESTHGTGIGAAAAHDPDAVATEAPSVREPAAQDRSAPLLANTLTHDRPGATALKLTATVVFAGAIGVALMHHKPVITAVESSGPLIGDGRGRDVVVSFDASGTTVDGVEVRFVRGDVPMDTQPMRVSVSDDQAARGRAAAGQLRLVTAKPASATYEYTLIDHDGKRSHTFEKTFTIEPGPTLPPMIADVRLPQALFVGRPFAAAIEYRAGNRPVTGVEYRSLDEAGRRSEPVLMPLADLAQTEPGVVTYAFKPLATPGVRTIEFALVDAQNVRSEPRRLLLDVAPVPARTAGVACVGAGCGRIVAVRTLALPDSAGPFFQVGMFFRKIFDRPTPLDRRRYAVTVRLDDGRTQVLTQSFRWRSGARVRVVDNRIVAVRT